MNNKGAIDVLKNEIKCVKSETCNREECRYCYLVLPEHYILEALEKGIKALSKEQAVNDAIKEIEDRIYEEFSADGAWAGGLSYALYVLKIHMEKADLEESEDDQE